MFSKARPHDVNVVTPRATTHFNGHKPTNSVFKSHHAAGESEKLVHGTRATNENDGEYFDESGWRRQIDSGDMALIPREDDMTPWRWASWAIFIVSVLGLGYVVWGM